jgi:hypothetical protein
VFGCPVCVVLRRNIIEQRKLRFDTSIVIGPDWDFLTHYSGFAQFKYLDQRTCLYRVHQTNISIRTDLQKRALHLAKCREKAIKMDNFKACSLETRAAVFYDLLVNLLTGFPKRQSAITQWPQFHDLPAENQALLFRLMASRAILREGEKRYIGEWLRLSRELNPADRRGMLLSALYGLSSICCQLLLRARTLAQPNMFDPSPFGNLAQEYSSHESHSFTTFLQAGPNEPSRSPSGD